LTVVEGKKGQEKAKDNAQTRRNAEERREPGLRVTPCCGQYRMSSFASLRMATLREV
jgi:hypothetical protein